MGRRDFGAGAMHRRFVEAVLSGELVDATRRPESELYGKTDRFDEI
jgi:hypothetical protein